MVNTVFQITYNILTPVIYLAVYMAVRDNPASPKLQQLSGRDIHKHTRFLVINPVIHTTDASSACFPYFRAGQKKQSLWSLYVSKLRHSWK